MVLSHDLPIIIKNLYSVDSIGTIDHVGSTADAVAKLETQRYDLVFLQLSMPSAT